MWWLKPLPLCNLGPSHSVQEEENEGETEDEEEEDDRRKRRRSDSYSLTFDESLSWCVIGGLGRVRDLQSSQSSDTHSTVRIWQTHTLRKLSSYPENKTTNTRIKIPERNWKSLNQGLKPSSLHGTFSHFNTSDSNHLFQSAQSEVTIPGPESDCDNFSVEFEVESIDSDDYNEDDASVSADDQVKHLIRIFLNWHHLRLRTKCKTKTL